MRFSRNVPRLALTADRDRLIHCSAMCGIVPMQTLARDTRMAHLLFWARQPVDIRICMHSLSCVENADSPPAELSCFHAEDI